MKILVLAAAPQAEPSPQRQDISTDLSPCLSEGTLQYSQEIVSPG